MKRKRRLEGNWENRKAKGGKNRSIKEWRGNIKSWAKVKERKKTTNGKEQWKEIKKVWEIVNKEKKRKKNYRRHRNEDMEKIFQWGGGRKGGEKKKEKEG